MRNPRKLHEYEIIKEKILGKLNEYPKITFSELYDPNHNYVLLRNEGTTHPELKQYWAIILMRMRKEGLIDYEDYKCHCCGSLLRLVKKKK